MCRADVPRDVIEKAVFNSELNQELQEDIKKVNNTINNQHIESTSIDNINQVKWFYAARKEGYWEFDSVSSELLEDAYQKWLGSNNKINTGFKPSTYKDENELIENGFIPIPIGGVNIIYFNFSQMYQFNHRNFATREIIRTDDISFMVKGIAGLKL
jgi:hypothetical protein